MAYTKNTWNTGDIVSSQKLNHMEDGIADAGGVMVINNNDNTLDKTWQEIYDAIGAVALCVVQETDTIRKAIDIVSSVSSTGNEYIVTTVMGNEYKASSSTGYPAASLG